MKKFAGVIFVFIVLAACPAHYPRSSSVSSNQTLENFSMKGKEGAEKSEELLFLLTFSGGGTRAAAFSYGVLEVLSDTKISVNGKERRLLDEVDAISSVSGGSFTAAYFGLFGDRIFEDYESKFLKYNVQSGLLKNMLSPLNWPKLWSLYYDRSDLAADYYDELLFEKNTFKGFTRLGCPLIAINATDAALKGKTTSTRQYHYANSLKAYVDTENYPYIHLFDGGISDNLGIRTIINATLATGDVWKKLKEVDLNRTEHLVIIVVNSRKDKDISFARKDFSVPIIDTLGVASSVPLDHYSFETMEILRENMKRWQTSINEGRCKETESGTGAEGKNDSVTSKKCRARTYLIEVSFDAIEDEAERNYLKDLPTTFHLKTEDVDRLRMAARQILQESDEFQDLIKSTSSIAMGNT